MKDILALGKAYIEGIRPEETEDIKRKYEMIKEVNNRLFEQIPYEVVFTEEDCYQSAREMREAVTKSNKIYIYKGGADDNPFLSEMENLKGRAVHDVFAHMVCGCPFSFKGELNAYYEQRKHYPKETWAVLFAEIPMQTASYYYNEKSFDFPQRAIEATEAEMKSVEHMVHDYSENSVLSVNQLIR